jgi:hypothetical protein
MVYLEVPKMSEHPIEQGIAGIIETYELLDRVRTRQDLVIRDDQFDYVPLLDAAAYARRKRIRLSLLDTGRFELTEIEALARLGARILTGDEARPRADEWQILLEACRASRTSLSVFWHGPLPTPDGTSWISLQSLGDLLGRGMDLHVSNRELPRETEVVAGLAAASKTGRGYCVYYHHGPLAGELAETAGRGAWIHFSDKSAADEAGAAAAVDIARAAVEAGARAAVHVETGLPLELLEALWEAGAVLLFLTPPSDHRSLLRPVERQAARRKLPPRAFHLSTTLMP